MRNELVDWQEAAGLSDEGLAVLLSDRTEREVPVERVRRWRVRPAQVPLYVREALGLDQRREEAATAPHEPSSDEQPFRVGDEPPAEPEAAERQPRPQPGRALEPVVPDFDVRTVHEVLTTAYQMVGKGAQYAARPNADGLKPDYERVFDAHAVRCADAWIELAKRDAKVARVLTTLTAGGAWGQVVLIHGSLVASLLVVAGKIRVPDGAVPLAPDVDARPAAQPPPSSDGNPHEPTPAV